MRGTPMIMSPVDDFASACPVSKMIRAGDMSRSPSLQIERGNQASGNTHAIEVARHSFRLFHTDDPSRLSWGLSMGIS